MKTLLICICLTLTMTLASPTLASDLAKLYPEKFEQAKNIYPMAKNFFQGPNSTSIEESLSPQAIKNPQRIAAYNELQQLLGFAIDTGIDISALNEFGLTKIDQGYIMDYQINPQWLSISRLLFFFTEVRHVENASARLITRGFSQNDIVKLKSYLKKHNPHKMALKAELKFLKSEQNKLLDNSAVGKSPKLNDIVKIHYKANSKRNEAWSNWGVKLLDTLPTYKQRILIDYLFSSIKQTIVVPTYLQQKYFENYSNQLITGELVAQLSKEVSQ